ncbi:MAG: hypothetical protein OCD02_05185 [Spirochaetaceae bacterium]
MTLPLSPNHFKDFISGLLGKPQSIEGDIHGTFEIDKGDLVQLHHLIEQRISQNDSSLVSLEIQVSYNDDSSITLTDFESLIAWTNSTSKSIYFMDIPCNFYQKECS